MLLMAQMVPRASGRGNGQFRLSCFAFARPRLAPFYQPPASRVSPCPPRLSTTAPRLPASASGFPLLPISRFFRLGPFLQHQAPSPLRQRRLSSCPGLHSALGSRLSTIGDRRSTLDFPLPFHIPSASRQFQSVRFEKFGALSLLRGLPGRNRPIAVSIGQLEEPFQLGPSVNSF